MDRPLDLWRLASSSNVQVQDRSHAHFVSMFYLSSDQSESCSNGVKRRNFFFGREWVVRSMDEGRSLRTKFGGCKSSLPPVLPVVHTRHGSPRYCTVAFILPLCSFLMDAVLVLSVNDPSPSSHNDDRQPSCIEAK